MREEADGLIILSSVHLEAECVCVCEKISVALFFPCHISTDAHL